MLALGANTFSPTLPSPEHNAVPMSCTGKETYDATQYPSSIPGTMFLVAGIYARIKSRSSKKATWVDLG
jgi:hypothetical protein